MSAKLPLNDEEILATLRNILNEHFDIAPERVEPSARLSDDLDLDSIDAVDVVIRLQNLTGKRIRPEEFKNVRTVDDVIAVVRGLLSAP